MQIANIILALGGDQRNTVPKYGVTVSEIAVLRAIHGEDAVTEIEPVGDIKRTSREELTRLKDAYPKTDPAGKNIVMTDLFPGGSRAYETFDDIDIDPSLFKPVTVMTAAAVAAKAKQDPLDHDNDGRKGGSLPHAPAAKMSATNPERQRGEPKPGSKKRTKAEIAEDEAADAADEEAERIAQEDAELEAEDEADGIVDAPDIMG
jgi:hypothetical protein